MMNKGKCYYKNEASTIYLADSFCLLNEIEEKSIDMIFDMISPK